MCGSGSDFGIRIQIAPEYDPIRIHNTGKYDAIGRMQSEPCFGPSYIIPIPYLG